MFSPNSPISDENQIPAVRTVHRKSVGRTPLKVLTGQHLAVPDANVFINKRTSLPKPPIHTVLHNKETTSVDTSKTINIWIDSCHSNTVTEQLDSEAHPLKKLQPCSLFTAKLSELDMKETMPVHCVQKQVTNNEDISILDEKDNKLNTFSTGLAANTFAIEEESLVLEDDASQTANDLTNPLPHTNLNASDNLTAASPQKFGSDFDTSLIEESIQLPVNNNNGIVNISSNLPLDFVKTGLSFTLSQKENGLVCKQLFEQCQVLGDDAQICTNNTYVLDASYNNGSEQDCMTTSTVDMVPEITVKIGKCKITATEAVGSYENVPVDDDDDNTTGRCLPVEELSSSFLQDSFMDDFKTAQLLNASSMLDESDNIGASVVTNEAAKCVLPHLSGSCLPIEDTDIVTEVFSVGHENKYSLADANTHFASVEGTTYSKCHTPISDMTESPCVLQKSMAEVSSTALDFPTPVSTSQLRVHKIPFLNSCVLKNLTPRILTSPHESGTSMTPILTSDVVTWTTPIMLLNKGVNTSWDVVGKADKIAKDNASETDSLLWNFSRETLCDASQEELLNHLESTLIVVEVLSRQLQSWQQDKVYSKPSEQRECSTQTCVTYCSTAEQYYHNLYLNALRRLQSLERCQEEEKQLHQTLKVAHESLVTQNNEATCLVELAENLYDLTQKDRVNLSQTVRRTHALLSEHMAFLSKTKEKIQQCLQQRDEMRASMEDAIRAKEAANQCLEDLEIHSSAVIASMRWDLESERQLREAVRVTYKEQISYNEELVEFVQSAQSVCSDTENDRTQLLRQCSEARALMSQHWRLFEVMKKKTQTALGEYEEIKSERDFAVLEQEEVRSHLKKETIQKEQLQLENSRLGSELESLMERLCKLESEIEQLKEENSELGEQLSAKDSSMKLLEKELNETTARGQEYQDRVKYLSAEIVPSLELDLSDVLKEKEALQAHLRKLKKDHAFQIAYYTESLEFLEQENSVCREQVSETETQLKTHHLTLLERNFQCENLKDTIKALQQELNELQEVLSNTKNEARTMRLKMNREISDSSTEVTKIRTNLLQLIENMRASTSGEAKGSSFEPCTPGGSLVLNNDHEEHINTTNLNAIDSKDQRTGIWSKTSAFTVVLPSPSAGTPPVNLPDVLHELSNVVTDVIAASSYAADSKQQIIEGLKNEISSLKKEQQSEKLQHTSYIHDLQVNLDILKKRNCILDEKINTKEKCISELQEVINQQEQKILQQFSKEKESQTLIEENEKLQLSLKLCENELAVLKEELAVSPAEAARNWIQEKLLLHKDLATLRLKLVDTEYAKSETVQRLMRHKDILTENLNLSEAEVRKLDNMIEKIRGVLFSGEDRDSCDTVRELIKILK